jgi:glycosyltransferase involved in cell wall biosynthesis
MTESRQPIPGRRTVCMLSVQPLLFDARVQKEARALRDAGWDVHVWHVDDQEFARNVPADAPARRAFADAMRGIPVHSVQLVTRAWRRLPKPLNKLLQAVELTCRAMAHVLSCGSSVYHCHDLTPGIFAIIGKLTGGAIVYDAHEVEVRSRQRIGRVVQGLYERLLVGFSDRVITVNEDIAALMQRRYGRSVAVVMNRPEYVALEGLDRTRVRRAANLPADARLLVYVGYVEPRRRGVERVIDSLPYLPANVHFLIIGVGRMAAFREHVHAHVASEKLNVAHRVHFLAPVPPQEISDYLSGADLSVMLYDRDVSKDLATPNKLFESVMARLPILGTDTPMLRRYILENGTGPIGDVADPADPRDVASRVMTLLGTAVQRTLRASAEKLAALVSWEGQAASLRAVYASLTAQ